MSEIGSVAFPPVTAGDPGPPIGAAGGDLAGTYPSPTIVAAARALFEGAVNVKDPAYGAVGDGVADDTTAILAAIAALPAGGGSVFFPAGNYLVSNTLTVDISNVTLYGVGPASKITLVPGTTTLRNVIRFNSSGSATPPRLSGCAIRFLKVDGAGGNTTWAAGGIPGTVAAYGCDDVDLDHVKVVNGRDHSVDVLGCTGVRLSYLTADTCYWQGASNPINIQGSTTVESDDTAADHCIVKHTTTVTISSATAAANTGTYTTAAAHKMSAGQPVKITGCSVAVYNGYWIVATVPTATTFTIALGSTPANSTGGTLAIQADRNIYCGGYNAYRLNVTNNLSQGAVVAIECEVNSPGVFDFSINDNTVYDFAGVGIGVENTSGNAAIYAHRGKLADNTIVGINGTTAFGRAASGSTAGIVIQGEALKAVSNTIFNVRQGIRIGSGSLDVDDQNLAAVDNEIYLSSDANSSGIVVDKTAATKTMRRLKIKGNLVDGGANAASAHGYNIQGRVVDFDLEGNTAYGMGRSGFYFQASGGVSPSRGRIRGNDAIDNSTNSSGTYYGFHVETGADDLAFTQNKAYDTRTPKLQGYGLKVDSGATRLTFRGNDWRGNLTGAASVVFDINTIYENNIEADGGATVASATTLTLPNAGRVITVSGTTTITSITASWADREVTLIFSGALTVTDGSNLKLDGNFVTAANAVLRLASDGTNWYEASRSQN